MNTQNTDKFLDQLLTVQKVETPDFLYTRILQKIENRKKEIVPTKIVWTMALSFLLLLFLNVMSISQSQHTKVHSTDLIDSFQLMPHNDLY